MCARKADSDRKPPSKYLAPVHTTSRSSPLSKEAPEQNFRGLYNLSLLLLFVLNLRLILENYQRYGFLVSMPDTDFLSSDSGWMVTGFAILSTNAYFALVLEQMAVGESSTLMALTQSLNVIATLAMPTYITWTFIENPIAGIAYLLIATILTLKLVSFHSANSELKDLSSLKDHVTGCKTDVYPANLTLSNLAFFAFAPTLCYQPTYPRSPSFRPTEFLKRFLELTITSIAAYALTIQYVIPLLTNSVVAVEHSDYLGLVERVLKLSVVSVVIWLLMFYSFFHSALNALSEVMCFGDRLFYESWWNSTHLGNYWKQWNLPVYNWSKRHIFVPLLKRGCPQGLASLVVFFVSAVLHELIIAVPTKQVTGLAFLGMMSQIPLIYMTAYIQSKRDTRTALFDTLGNMIFWLSITIVGQPTAIILYYASWSKRDRL